MAVGAVIPIDIEAKDADAGINSLVEYKVVPSLRNNSVVPLPGEVGTEPIGPLDEATADGFGVFEFASSHKAVVTLRRSLDYETVRRYLVTIVASVRFFISHYSAHALSNTFVCFFGYSFIYS